MRNGLTNAKRAGRRGDAAIARLRRSSCAAPGFSRRRRGRGFEYRDADGERIDDPEVIERIAGLAIPPAWRDVWICMDPLGHLQATGRDAAGRKQYLYHERWRSHRDRLKFDTMLAFGKALPRLRRRVSRELGSSSAPLTAEDLIEERVLACAVRLLDVGFFRIGSDDYAERNESYGLTTLLREHVTITGGSMIFDYRAKSGQRRVQEITDAGALAVVAALRRRRAGQQLLAYRTARGWSDVAAADVNEYIKRHMSEVFSAKDFRTWNASVLAAVALAATDPRDVSGPARERAVRDAVRTVSAYLGNTPAVCRTAYIDPRVIDRFHAGHTIAETLGHAGDLARPRERTRIEAAVLELLSDADT
ncbi:MAG TPA: DNA topoisomerase IB [Solirubrobacteraceae bacterium]|nr:DNA topoisomerase IB [Solirubrobacteraceae bacterium]